MSAQSPIDFGDFRRLQADFFGRQDILDRIDERLEQPRQTGGYLLIKGSPGLGKSCIVSRWLTLQGQTPDLPSGTIIVPHHFIRAGVDRWEDPAVIVDNLAVQVEMLYPDLVTELTDLRPEMRLRNILGAASRAVLARQRKRLIVVVDGLDEAVRSVGGVANPLTQFLPPILPRGVFFICTTRPMHGYLDWIEVDAIDSIELDEGRWAESNQSACREFWAYHGPKMEPPLPVAIREAAVERGEGNMLYSVQLKRWLDREPRVNWRPDMIPRGLAGLMADAWASITKSAILHPYILSGLGLLTAAREALPLIVLEELSEWPKIAGSQNFLLAVRPYLLEEPGEFGISYRLYHSYFRQYLVGALGTAHQEYHAVMAAKLGWPPSDHRFRRRYALRNVVAHHIAAGNWPAAIALCTDLDFIRTRLEESDGAELAAEFEILRAVAPENSTSLVDLALAVRKEFHSLRAYPSAAAMVLYNRLIIQGWSDVQVRDSLLVRASSLPLRLRHSLIRKDQWVRTVKVPSSRVSACASTPDGRKVATGSEDGVVRIWDIELGTVRRKFEGEARRVHSCEVSSDGQFIVATYAGSNSANGSLWVWNVASGELRAHIVAEASVVAWGLSRDWTRAVSGTSDGTVVLWDVENAVALKERSFDHELSVCSLTEDRRFVILGSKEGIVEICDAGSMNVVRSLIGHSGPVNSCVVTADGLRCVSGSSDRTLRIWDLTTGHGQELKGHGSEVTRCVLTSDQRGVVSASGDHTLKVWDLAEGREVQALECHAGSLWGCVSLSDLRVLAVPLDGTLQLWDLTRPISLSGAQGHRETVGAIASSVDGRTIVSGSDDKTIRVWDSETGVEQRLLREPDDQEVNDCAITPDDQYVVSVYHDGSLRKWDLAQGTLLWSRAAHTQSANACAVTPDGVYIITASTDKTIKVWRATDGEPIRELSGHDDVILAVTVAPDGRHVVSGAADGTLRVWDLDNGAVLRSLKGHTERVIDCRVTPNGRYVISASGDKTLRVWELSSGRMVRILRGHDEAVLSCAVSSEGHVFSASQDRTIRVWSLEEGTCLTVLPGPYRFTSLDVRGANVTAGDSAGNVWLMTRKRVATQSAPSQPTAAPPAGALSSMTILMVSASPTSQERLREGEEFRKIKAIVGRRHPEEHIRIEVVRAARFEDLRTALADHKPHVLHLSCHGSPDGALILEDDARGARELAKSSLKALIENIPGNLNLVLLNACHSEVIARDLHPIVPLAIGMNGPVYDDSAIDFAESFYDILALGTSVEAAFRVGVASLDYDEQSVPRLFPADSPKARQPLLAPSGPPTARRGS